MTPNKDRLRLWVKALRSDRFTQAKGTLVKWNDNRDARIGHCCLGVATEVALENGFPDTFNVWEEGHELMAPSVGGWFGLNRQDPPIYRQPHGHELRASEANDRLSWDFNQIADAIEKYYELDKS